MKPRPSPDWLEAQYNNRVRVPGYSAALQDWADASAAALRRPGWVLDLSYGEDASERLDILAPAGAGAPVLVYIHGGYWRALDKRDHAFVAPPLADAGALVITLNYALCPSASIDHIVLQLVRALAWVYRHARTFGGNPDHIVLAGHSAGGHLATMLLACNWSAVAADLPASVVKSALSISGLYDLEPFRHTPFLASDLNLTASSALRLSPAYLPAPAQGSLVTVVGGDESEEFHRHAALIRKAWGPRVVVASEIEPGRNHMDVINELAVPGSLSYRAALMLLGLHFEGAGRARPNLAR